jgi:hypothetical protein
MLLLIIKPAMIAYVNVMPQGGNSVEETYSNTVRPLA